MANRKNGEIPLEINGTTYTLVLNTDAMARLEDYFSTSAREMTWDEIWARVIRGSVKYVRALVWVMLLKHHPTITLVQAGALIDDVGGLEGLANVLQDAAKDSTPDPKDVKELGVSKGPRKAQTKRRGTGGGSSSTRGASA